MRDWVRLEHLWPLLALSLIASFISLVPTAPHDFWWHLRAGELTASSGIPQTNLFAWTLPAEHPYIYQSWLGELLFYRLYQAGGLPLVIFARNLLGAAAFALVAVEAHRRSGSWRLAALAALLAGLMTINNLGARTQNWSWLPFVAYLAILGRYVDGQLGPRWLAALPLIMIFWVNAHGAFVLGLLLLGAFLAGETIRRLLRQAYGPGWPQLRALALAAAATAAATLANPLGPGIYGYVGTLLGNRVSQSLVIEWQPPSPESLAGGFFYLGVLGLLAAFGLGRRRPTITEVLLACGLAWQAFGGMRYVVWFGMAAMPLLAQSLGSARAGRAAPAGAAGRERGGGGLANLATALLLLAMPLLLQPWVKPLLPLPEPYRAIFAAVPGAPQLFSAETPVAAVEHLRERPCAGPLFNEMGYGSYLAWALYPQAQSFIDTRIELYPEKLWQDYIAISEGQGALSLLERYGVGCVLLDRPRQGGLAEALAADPAWAQSFAAGRSEVWRRTE